MVKRITLFLIVFCSQAFAVPVSNDVAQVVALNFFNSNTYANYTAENISEIITESKKNESIYYIINFTPKGWIIVSADDIASPVIGYSPNGHYTLENRPPAFGEWMEHAATEIRDAIETYTFAEPEKMVEWAHLNTSVENFRTRDYADGDTNDVAPLLSTSWNQNSPYNASCPADSGGPGGKVYAGCVATAMAQVIKYHRYPETGWGSHSYDAGSYGTLSADFENTTYSYDSMPDGPDPGSNYSDIAQLIYHCGVSVEMNYGSNGSGANTSSDATNALKHFFKYDISTRYESREDNSDWETVLIDELKAGRPVLYRGSGSGGHAFVCDGYQEGSGFHFNWGWSGSYNGYFAINDLTPGSYTFSNDQGGIIGIKPTDMGSLTYPYLESFEAVEFAENIDVSGNRVAISAAESKSGSHSLLIGTPDGTGYSDNSATIKINVPSGTSQLIFHVKRRYDPSESQYNDHSAKIKTLFGDTTLHTIFNGDFNDSDWQEISLNLTSWAGTTILLELRQYNRSSSYKQWMYIDDVEVITDDLRGDIDGNSEINLIDAILSLQIASNQSISTTINGDVNGDSKIGLAETVFILQHLGQLR